MFLFILILSIVLQLFIIEVGGAFFSTKPLTLAEILFCVCCGVLSLPLYQLARTVPADWFVSIGGSKCDDFTVPKETILTGRNSLSKSRLSSVTSGQFVDSKMVRVFTQ